MIVDSRLRIPKNAKVLLDENAVIATTKNFDTTKKTWLTEHNIAVWEFDSIDEHVPLLEVLRKLGERNITSLLCEGGGTVASSFLREQLVDKVIFVVAQKILGNGVDAVKNLNVESIEDALCLKESEIEILGNDIIVTVYPEYKNKRQ